MPILGRGAWYRRHKGLERELAERKPRPLLGLTEILPDDEIPQDGPVKLPCLKCDHESQG